VGKRHGFLALGYSLYLEKRKETKKEPETTMNNVEAARIAVLGSFNSNEKHGSFNVRYKDLFFLCPFLSFALSLIRARVLK